MLNKIAKYKNTKALFANIISLSILQITNYALPFVTLPYLSHILGVKILGELAYATAIVAYFQAIVEYGFNYIVVRDISKLKNNTNLVSKIFWRTMYARLYLVLLSFIVLLCLCYTIPIFKISKGIILLTFLYIPGYAFFPDWFFQGMEKMKFITILNFISKFIFTLLIFLLIKAKSDYYFYPLIISCGYLVSCIIAMYLIIKRFNIIFIRPSQKQILLTIKSNTNMFINSFLPNLYNNFSTIILNIYRGPCAVGLFDSGNKFINLSQQLSNIITRAFFPYLARKIDNHKYFIYINLFISILICLVLYIGAPLFIKTFYTKEFKESVSIIRYMSITPLLFFFINTYGTNYLVLIKKEKTLRNITIYSSILGLTLSLSLINNYGIYGVIITLITTRMIMGLLMWKYAVKFKKSFHAL